MLRILAIALGVMVAFNVFILGYGLLTGKAITGGVQEKLSALDPGVVEQIRSNPGGTFIHAKDENLPAFLAFLDLDTAVTDNAVAEYRDAIERLEKYYKDDTRKDIVQAAFYVHTANVYYPSLTYLESLRYLGDTIPQGAAKDAGGPPMNVRQASEEVQSTLVLKYYEPLIEARKQQQAQQQAQQTAQAEYQARLNETINQNLAKAKAEGAARNAARAEAAAAQSRFVQQQVNWAYQDYRNRVGYGYHW